MLGKVHLVKCNCFDGLGWFSVLQFDEIAATVVERIRVDTVAFSMPILRSVIVQIVALIAVDSITLDLIVDCDQLYV